MTAKVQISVGTLADMGSRFASAWNRAADGAVVDETHITFLDVQSMLAALSRAALTYCATFASTVQAMSASWPMHSDEITKMSTKTLKRF